MTKKKKGKEEKKNKLNVLFQSTISIYIRMFNEILKHTTCQKVMPGKTKKKEKNYDKN